MLFDDLLPQSTTLDDEEEARRLLARNAGTTPGTMDLFNAHLNRMMSGGTAAVPMPMRDYEGLQSQMGPQPMSVDDQARQMFSKNGDMGNFNSYLANQPAMGVKDFFGMGAGLIPQFGEKDYWGKSGPVTQPPQPDQGQQFLDLMIGRKQPVPMGNLPLDTPIQSIFNQPNNPQVKASLADWAPQTQVPPPPQALPPLLPPPQAAMSLANEGDILDATPGISGGAGGGARIDRSVDGSMQAAPWAGWGSVNHGPILPVLDNYMSQEPVHTLGYQGSFAGSSQPTVDNSGPIQRMHLMNLAKDMMDQFSHNDTILQAAKINAGKADPELKKEQQVNKTLALTSNPNIDTPQAIAELKKMKEKGDLPESEANQAILRRVTSRRSADGKGLEPLYHPSVAKSGAALVCQDGPDRERNRDATGVPDTRAENRILWYHQDLWG